jgi:hypothetical protein
MNTPKPELPKIAENERTPLIDVLLELLAWQSKRIDELEQEILKLKNETLKPKIAPTKMDEEEKTDKASSKKATKPEKLSKTKSLKIDETVVIEPENIPEGSKFKGFREVVIQDIIFKTHNTCYRLAQYQCPDGHYVSGEMPKGFTGCHYGKELISYILYQYHHQHVTQPLLLAQLHDIGVEISSGRLSEFITENLDIFHDEKDEILKVGLSVSAYIHADDTGARHDGKTGYCTHIGNELFAWFSSTEAKSRVNFLSLLNKGIGANYVLNEGAFEYLARQKLPLLIQERLLNKADTLNEKTHWESWLDELKVIKPNHRKTVTEAALLGGLFAQGIPADLGIMSDDAGQFNVFDHALCWIHAERVINRLIPLNPNQAIAVEEIRGGIWAIYRDLKAYKLNPVATQADSIRQRFKELCQTKTCYATMNEALKRMGKNEHELLRVLDKPYLPLHNNLSERDIREYVKKRKISGSTRSESGRRCRDTFASLKKTCRKHGVSFWHYLKARLLNDQSIQPLSVFIKNAAATCG